MKQTRLAWGLCGKLNSLFLHLLLLKLLNNFSSYICVYTHQDALDSPLVTACEYGWRDMGFCQPLQKVQMLLGSLFYGAGEEESGEVLCHVNTKEFGGLNLHRRSIDVQLKVVAPWFREVNNHLCCC